MNSRLTHAVLLVLFACTLFVPARAAIGDKGPHTATRPAGPAATAVVTFQEIDPGMESGYVTDISWGDYDNDGDLDAALAGELDFAPDEARIYNNALPNTFIDISAGLYDAALPSLAWGDFNNDGNLDLIVCGLDRIPQPDLVRATLYRNNGNNTFSEILSGVQPLDNGSVEWGDYNNDGLPDLLITGFHDTPSVGATTAVYRNNGNGTFTDINAGLPGVRNGCAAWGDYDNDGDLDIVVAGNTTLFPATQVPIARVYRNDGNDVFVLAATLTGVYNSAVAWGDYDNDGDLDLALIGNAGTDASIVPLTSVYRNDGGTFTAIATGIVNVEGGSVSWGDYDNDGDIDLLITGYTGSGGASRVYSNGGGGTFANVSTPMPGVWYSAAEWGDYDNDGDLDIALAGTKTGDPSGDWTRVYRSSGALPNSPPSTPGNLHAYREGNQLIATWDPSTDATTPSAGLSYNIRVGSTPGGSDIVNPMAGADGQRRVARIGNAQKRTSWSINVSQPGPYYVAVQAIDAAYAGSAFGTATVGVDGRESSGLDFAVVGANPAQAKARFWFSMPVAGHATIEAFDVLGRVVANIVDEELAAGAHEVSWNFGRAGEKVPAGMYIARLSVGGAFKVRPVVVLN